MKNVVNIVLNDFVNDSRVMKTSRTLARLNNSVTVVALHNEGLLEKENSDLFEVVRVKLFSRGWLRFKPIQMLKYLEFLVRVTWRYRKADVIHCNDLNALPIGLLIKFFRRRTKVVYDCHEYETELHGLKGIEKKAKKLLERSLIGYADNVITVSESIANEYSRLYGIKKPLLVLNCPEYVEQPKRNLLRDTLNIRLNQNIFLYQGGLSKGRGIELLLEAFSDIDDDLNVIVFMGYGPLENQIKEKVKSNKNIFFHPAVEPKVLLDYTSSADYGILFYEDTCLNHRYCSPNKIFEYLMAGLPVITSNLFEVKRLVETHGIGFATKENSASSFRDTIIATLEEDYSFLKENVTRVRRKYSWEEQEKVLEHIYN